MSVQPVLAEDGTETGAYLVSDVNVTKNMEFKVDAVKLYSVTIADRAWKHGRKVTKPDGTEVENGEMIDEKTVLTYTATRICSMTLTHGQRMRQIRLRAHLKKPLTEVSQWEQPSRQDMRR